MKATSALALATLLFSGCCRKPKAPPTSPPDLPAAQVRVQTAESKQRATTEDVVGTIGAKLRATLEAKLSGRIDKMPVALGQTVKAGQLVAHLDAAEVKARLDQAEASRQQAERDWKRTSTLFAQQAATRFDYDAAESRYEVAKAAAAEAQAMMGYVEVLAPFDGVVTKKWADVGDLATPGKPLVAIEDPSMFQLEADVPDAIASGIQQNAQLPVQVDSLKGELVGIVREIAPTADTASRTFRVRLDLPQTAGLRSGQFARVVVAVGERSSARVPISAVILRGQLEILFVVTKQRAQLHLVKTGRTIGDEVEVLAGLESGESVVVRGADLLVDGQPVEVK